MQITIEAGSTAYPLAFTLAMELIIGHQSVWIGGKDCRDGFDHPDYCYLWTVGYE